METNIHFIHFGNEPLTELQKQRIDSFRKYNPNCTIKIWTEFECTNQFLKDALLLRNYAYISDYYRLKILYEYGGFYCDTDTECFKSLDPLFKYDQVLEYEFQGRDGKLFIGTAIMGFKKRHPFLKILLDIYENDHIIEYNHWPLCKINQFIITDVYNQVKPGFDILPLKLYHLFNHDKNPFGFTHHHADLTWGKDYSFIIPVDHIGEDFDKCINSLKKIPRSEIILAPYNGFTENLNYKHSQHIGEFDLSLISALSLAEWRKTCFIFHNNNDYNNFNADNKDQYDLASIGDFDLEHNDAMITHRFEPISQIFSYNNTKILPEW